MLYLNTGVTNGWSNVTENLKDGVNKCKFDEDKIICNECQNILLLDITMFYKMLDDGCMHTGCFKLRTTNSKG